MPAAVGSIEVFGTDLRTASPATLRALRRRFGFVFQDPAASLNPRASVGACICEPLSVQAAVLALFQRLQAEMGFACLFISHDLAVIDLVADDVAVMSGGKLVEIGSTAEVLRAPTHPCTGALLAAVPVPDPAEQRERRRAAGNLA